MIQYVFLFLFFCLVASLVTVVATVAIQQIHIIRMDRAINKIAQRKSIEEQERKTPLIGIDLERGLPPDITLRPIISFSKSPLNRSDDDMERLRKQIIEGFSDIMKKSAFASVIENRMHQNFLNEAVGEPYSERGN